MPVAAFVGDVDDLGVGIREQLPGALQAQFGLARAQRHAELLAEQPAEMPLAAMQLRRQFRQRARRDSSASGICPTSWRKRSRNLLPPAAAAGGAAAGRRRRCAQSCSSAQRIGSSVALRLRRRAAQISAPSGSCAAKSRRGGGRCWRDLQLMPFRHGEQAVEKLRLHGEILQLQHAELAGAQQRVGAGAAITKPSPAFNSRAVPPCSQ